MLRLDLQPVPRPCLLVRAFAMLRDDAFETARGNRFKEIRPSLFDMIVESNPAAIGCNQLPQHGFALLEWKARQVESVEIEQIKRIEIDGDALVGLGNVTRSREMDAGLD